MGRNKHKGDHKKEKNKKLSEKDVITIAEKVYEFSNLDLSSETLGSIGYKRKKLLELLEQRNIKPNSKYHKKIDRIYQDYETRFAKNTRTEIYGPHEQSEQFPRRYTGIIRTESGGYTLRIKVFLDHFILIRTYDYDRKYIKSPHEHLDISWKFDYKGRVNVVNIILPPKKSEPYNLIKLIDFWSTLPEHRKAAEARYNQIPPEVDVINPKMETSLAIDTPSSTPFGDGGIPH